MINTILISLSCLLICSCLAFIFFSNRNRTGLLLSRLPYKKIDKIFTPAELNFYKSLNKVVSARFKIFGKVRIADVIELEGNLPERSRVKLFNQIAYKHFDYIICDDTLRICLAIELDDSTHARKDRFRRDVLVNDVCRASGLPLLRIPAKKHYDIEDLKRSLTQYSIETI